MSNAPQGTAPQAAAPQGNPPPANGGQGNGAPEVGSGYLEISDKGFGFLLASEGNAYFFHNSACSDTRFDDPREHHAVTFEKSQAPPVPRGATVRVAYFPPLRPLPRRPPRRPLRPPSPPAPRP